MKSFIQTFKHVQFIYLEKVMKQLCDDLRVKLNVNISSQVWFVIAADLE